MVAKVASEEKTLNFDKLNNQSINNPSPKKNFVFILCVRKSSEVWFRISDHEVNYDKNNVRMNLLTKITNYDSFILHIIKKMPKCLSRNRKTYI